MSEPLSVPWRSSCWHIDENHAAEAIHALSAVADPWDRMDTLIAVVRAMVDNDSPFRIGIPYDQRCARHTEEAHRG